MAEEFKVIVGAELKSGSVSKIKTDINNIKLTPIKITLNTSEVEKQIKSIKTQIEDLGKIKITLGGSGTSSNSGLAQTQKQAQAVKTSFTELMALQRRMNSTNISLAKLDSGTEQYKTLTAQLEKLQAEYNKVKSSLEVPLSTGQMTKLNASIDQTKDKIAQLSSKAVDAQNKLKSDIKFRVDTGEFEKSISSIDSKINKLKESGATVSTSLQSNFTKLKTLANTMKTSTSTTEINRAYKEYGTTLKTVQNELSKTITAQKNMGQQAQSSGNSLKSFATSYLSMMLSITTAIRAFKSGFDFIHELDDALTNISYTMDITDSKLQEIGKSAISMADDLKTSASTVLEAVTLYANANESAESILNKATTAVSLANVTGMTGTEAAKMLQSVMNQFDLTEDHLEYISDTIQGVSQNMAYDFSSGVKEIAAGIEQSGSVAQMAGLDLADYASMLGLVIEKTGQSGSTVGNAFKTNNCLYVQKCA